MTSRDGATTWLPGLAVEPSIEVNGFAVGFVLSTGASCMHGTGVAQLLRMKHGQCAIDGTRQVTSLAGRSLDCDSVGKSCPREDVWG